ncbi:MAG: hypothetical protein ACKVW3_01220 [Phycisphaerales bacterium]
MRRVSVAAVAMSALGCLGTSSASAHLFFEEIAASGSLSTGYSSVFLGNEVWYTFPMATVGDQQLVRTGETSQTLRAYHHFPGLDLDWARITVLGDVAGSGTIRVSGTMENADTSAVVATFDFTLGAGTVFPFEITFPLVPITHHVRLNGLVTLNAPETPGTDIARLDQMKYYFNNTPAPGALGLVAAAGLWAGRRRRAR